MIYFIKFDRLSEAGQNYLNPSDKVMLGIRDSLLGSGVSNLFFYSKKLPKAVRDGISEKRRCNKLTEVDYDLINQKSVIILHHAVINDLSPLANYCLNNDKMLFVPYDNDTMWDENYKIVDVRRYRGGKGRKPEIIRYSDNLRLHPFNFSMSFIDDLTALTREFKLLYLLNQ